MDFRTPRPADRTPVSRARPAQPPADEARPASEAPKAAYRPAVSGKKKSSKRFLWPIVILLVAVVLGVACWLLWSKSQTAGTAIDTSKYQAVFFTNGQVYFGKLQAFNDEYMKLKDIFYLQTQAKEEADPENPQKTTTDQNDVQLIKLGDEIHGPQDEMVISRDQILFYENLKPDGKVSQSIEKFKKP